MIKPSQIEVSSPFDFIDLFGRSEAEQWAVLMVWTLAAGRDEWDSVTPKEIANHLGTRVAKHVLADEHDEPPSWASNPWFRPDGLELVRRGFAEFTGPGEPEGVNRPMRFTAAALELLTARFG